MNLDTRTNKASNLLKVFSDSNGGQQVQHRGNFQPQQVVDSQDKRNNRPLFSRVTCTSFDRNQLMLIYMHEDIIHIFSNKAIDF